MTEELWRQKVLEELEQISHLLTMLLAAEHPIHPTVEELGKTHDGYVGE